MSQIGFSHEDLRRAFRAFLVGTSAKHLNACCEYLQHSTVVAMCCSASSDNLILLELRLTTSCFQKVDRASTGYEPHKAVHEFLTTTRLDSRLCCLYSAFDCAMHCGVPSYFFFLLLPFFSFRLFLLLKRMGVVYVLFSRQLLYMNNKINNIGLQDKLLVEGAGIDGLQMLSYSLLVLHILALK